MPRVITDVDADGHGAAVTFGSRINAVLASHAPVQETAQLSEEQSATQLLAMEVEDRVQERVSLREQHVTCDGLATLRDTSGSTRIALLSQRVEPPQRVELVLASSASSNWGNASSEAAPIADAPLAQNFAVP